MSAAIKKRFPNIQKALLVRHRVYNRQLELCRELERRGKALIFRPSEKLVSFQSDVSELERYYKTGYDEALAAAKKIKAFMG